MNMRETYCNILIRSILYIRSVNLTEFEWNTRWDDMQECSALSSPGSPFVVYSDDYVGYPNGSCLFTTPFVTVECVFKNGKLHGNHFKSSGMGFKASGESCDNFVFIRCSQRDDAFLVYSIM